MFGLAWPSHRYSDPQKVVKPPRVAGAEVTADISPSISTTCSAKKTTMLRKTRLFSRRRADECNTKIS